MGIEYYRKLYETIKILKNSGNFKENLLWEYIFFFTADMRHAELLLACKEYP